ncbi:MAG: cysteine hydrolase [Desulfobacterales bacterium]|nr:MAG: cysteine hydrolase [Desulfobacterales bacterium]
MMIPKVTHDYITDFTSDFELEPKSTALIIVDMQYATASRHDGLGKWLQAQGKTDLSNYRFERVENVVLPTIKRLLAFFRENQLAVIYLTMGSRSKDYSDALPHLKALFRSSNNYVGSSQHRILEEIQPKEEELVIHKTTIGAFSSTNLDSLLWSKGLTYLVFTGVSTNMCVETTARDAADRGFRCVLIEDGCGASAQNYHDAAMTNFQRLFGKVKTSAEVIAELAAKIKPPS